MEQKLQSRGQICFDGSPPRALTPCSPYLSIFLEWLESCPHTISIDSSCHSNYVSFKNSSGSPASSRVLLSKLLCQKVSKWSSLGWGLRPWKAPPRPILKEQQLGPQTSSNKNFWNLTLFKSFPSQSSSALIASLPQWRAAYDLDNGQSPWVDMTQILPSVEKFEQLSPNKLDGAKCQQHSG